MDDPRRHHGADLPFCLGQRTCIGDAFAQLEAQLVLTTMLQRVRLELVPGQRFKPEPMATLRPRGGIQIVAHPRGPGP
ncbi:MAG: cytochrome P450 [Myxococcaceae bacterium]|nr:cytochrome P450 [Myxococcaceae bacterium]MCA3016384.1 cytochrome P450 [Myxococcaceae bacterium]